MTISDLTFATSGSDSVMNSIIDVMPATSTYGFGAMTLSAD
jgi:hypothetical protein